MKSFLFALLAILGLGFTLFSFQSTKFSGDPTLYPDELKEFMRNVSDTHEETLDIFLEGWENDSSFSFKEKENIIRLSQGMIQRKARPYPHFVNFIQCMLILKEGKVTEANYVKWVNAMDAFLENKKTSPSKINSFLTFSFSLFQENAISKSSSTLWRATSIDYEIFVGDKLEVRFKNTDLKCFTRTDSIELFNTQGTVFPIEKKWVGRGGVVTWERGGYLRAEVFATLVEYEIDLKRSEYKAENVVFTNKKYFKEPLEGQLSDKVKHVKTQASATYPKFLSYAKTFNIENLYEGVNYSGGLSMQGAKMVGTGTRDNLARLYIFRKDTLVMESSSLYFGFKSDRVVSERTSINIRLKQDSIFHPDLFLDFRTKNRELILLKTDNFTSQGPYSNSYHNVEMNFEQLVWRIDEDYMRFTAPKGTTIGNGNFESVNYFNFNKYLNMQMMDQMHPLLSLRKFSQIFGGETFPVEAYADYLNISISQVKQYVMRISYGGFIYYDNNSGMISIKPKLHDYIAASVNRIDYDVISFSSTTESPLENALFDLGNYDLIINGIPQIRVSDSQNVKIYPKNDRIILKENRNFQFDGTVEAGLMTFSGSNLFFHYDSFKINMQKVDAIKLDYLTGDLDNYGLAAIGSINNMIQGLTGELLIDNHANKSGRENFPDYPIFKSKEKSYVYYESPNIHGGAYDANDFFFAVDPFTMDSLDNFNAYSMVYEGEFVSAGILPTLREKLSLQEDNSLGFKHQTPIEGIPLYEGKGTYNNEIRLSNQGLRGDGILKYLRSTTWSDDFMFFPDSVNALSQKYQIDRQTTTSTTPVEYPRTLSANNEIHWEPYADVMWAYKTDQNFKMFNDSTFLSGTLQLEPTGLSGWGSMDLKNSDLHSEWFSYKSDEILADTSDFYLKSLRAEGFTVLTENVSSHINYRQRKAWFRSNEGYSLVTFPENRYISYIDYFIWDMTKKELAMGAKSAPELPDYTHEDIEPEGPRFISTDPKQDSISFVSPLAYYDYQNNLIKATGVKFLDIADARIYPDSGLVTVNPNYKIRVLEKSWLKANRFSQLHRLHTATINIESRKNYYGMANYDYVDENSDVQMIHFKEVKVDTGMQTNAIGEIFEKADFHLSPVYHYQGNVSLFAKDSLLTFNGATQIEHACDMLKSAWLDFETRIDPNSIYIPIDDSPIDINRMKIFNSMFVYYDSVHVYPAFLSSRKAYSDIPMIQPKGYLYYDKAQHLYKIGSKEKINDFTLSEDYLSFHREDCKLSGEGNINLGNELGMLSLTNYGTVKHDLEKETTELSLVMGLEFFMNEDMINLMGADIDSFPNLKPVNINRSVVKKANNAWVGKEKANQLRDELNLFGTIKVLPDELNYTILLNDLNLIWNNETNSYQSVGQIGIASINGIQINKKLDGFFELRIKRSGDMMDLYLQLDRGNYYYFGYTRGVMQTLSHNRTYVETIMDMKANSRKAKTPKGATPYNYLISTARKKNNFYRRWQDAIGADEGSTGEN